MQTNVHINEPWLRPSQNIDGSIMVTVKNTTTRTAMNTNRQRLPYPVAALAAILTCVASINHLYLHPGAFCLECQYVDKLAPASVRDATSQSVVLEKPLDVQAFHRNGSVVFHELMRNLMVHVASGVCDSGVEFGDSELNLLSGRASFLASTQGPLASAKFLEPQLQSVRITKTFTVAGGDERVQSKVNTNAFGRYTQSGNIQNVYGDAGIPFIVFAFDYDSKDLGVVWQFSMPANANYSDVLKFDFASHNPATTAMPAKAVAYRVKPVLPFESRKAMVCDGEKALIGALQSFHRLLCGREVQPGIVGIRLALNCEPAALFLSRPLNSSRLPAKNLSIEELVIQSPVRFERGGKLPLLVGVREQSELIGLNHLLAFFLQVGIDGTPDEFGIAQTRLLGQRLEGGNLLIGQKYINSFHTYIIHT